MTIEREHYEGPISVCCDECGEVNETHCTDFISALAKAKSHGFVARKEGAEWFHYCKDCK